MGILFKVINDTVILDRWSTVIPEGAGLAEQLYQRTEHFIRQSQAPGVRIRRKTLAPGWLEGIFGSRRKFLEVSTSSYSALGSYVIDINGSDYGDSMVVSWFLITRIGALGTVVGNVSHRLSGKEVPATLTADLDLFQKNIQLKGFATTVHRALLQAVDELMQGLGQDTNQIDPRTGFLGLS